MSKKSDLYDELFSSLISDIKNFSGKDPLLPWLRGIRKMRDSLPPQLLKEKLPRFLQKCGQTFLSDRRYANDLRYVRVWIQLMDFVDDPRAVLKTMETNRIGMKKSLFYQAYALYYEKIKKFEEAERMYYLGIQNFAEPAGELLKSHEKFLQRMEHHKKKKKTQGVISHKVPPSSKKSNSRAHCNDSQVLNSMFIKNSSDLNTKMDDTVVVEFVDTSVVGKSEAEDARHHGLVEPTINTKEAMDVINDMFKEPLESSFNLKRSPIKEPKDDRIKKNELGKEPLHVFVDDDVGNDDGTLDHNSDQEEEDSTVGDDEFGEGFNAFVLSRPSDEQQQQHSKDQTRHLHREDTFVHRFVGSTILHEPRVENACHHGLVEPTINLKEAMEDINNMFGKPIEFARKTRPKKHEASNTNNIFTSSSFSILHDDDELVGRHPSGNPSSSTLPNSSSDKENELFEQTVCTKEAMDEINKMFGMPLDF